MLRRSYLSNAVAVLGAGFLSSGIESTLSEGREKPVGWDELSAEDKQHIRQFLRRRKRQGAKKWELRHDLRNLVGMASMHVEGLLTTADMSQFGKVATRQTRALPQFLIFTGSEAPKCPKCGNREYQPSDQHPDKMRCKGCAFLYTNRELAGMVSPGL